MNLSKSINIKNKFKNINPITNASIDVKFLNNSNNFLLDCDSIIKMVIIKYKGNIRIKPANYKGMRISASHTKIIIINYSKQPLVGNVLFEYNGRFENIARVKVLGWGCPFVDANLRKNSKYSRYVDESPVFSGREKMGLNRNKWDKTNDTFSDEAKNILHDLRQKHTPVKISKRGNVSEQLCIFGLYTGGKKFRYGNKYYVGKYHYNLTTKKFSTGFKPLISSFELTPVTSNISKNKRGYFNGV